MAADRGMYLHVLPLAAAPDVSLAAAREIDLALYSNDPKGLSERIIGWPVGSVESDHVRVRIGHYPRRVEQPRAQHLAPSFIVDYDEAAVVEVRERAIRRFGADPSAEELRRFVAEWINEKTLGRGRDIASQVARRRAGDCTEHAVLLAALLRSFGSAARLLQGTVIADLGAGPGAFGHAWTEVFAKGAWRLVDAALSESAGVFYIPDFEVDDEGPGSAMAQIQALASGSVTRVEILGSVR